MTFAATERNLAIVEAYRNRPHIKAIGEQFSITGTRVLQIVVQYERATGDKLPRGNQSGPRNAEGERIHHPNWRGGTTRSSHGYVLKHELLAANKNTNTVLLLKVNWGDRFPRARLFTT